MNRRMKKLALCLLLVAASIDASSAAEKGWFGFGVAIKAEGFFLNPILTAVTIDTVEARSPAAEKGIAIGDEIVRVGNTDVPGHRALELRSLMQKTVGESLQLKLKRPNGGTYSVTLIAAKKPA
jgi:C-terminal processing protease CtpA/Prc